MQADDPEVHQDRYAGSLRVMLMGGVADAAAGDTAWKILRFKSEACSVVYIDRQTQAGGVFFEK